MKPKRGITVKGKNRRVEVYHNMTEENESRILVITKRLVDREKRKIMCTNIIYSYATLKTLRDILVSMFADDEFIKDTQHEFDEMLLQKWEAKTNMESLLNTLGK